MSVNESKRPLASFSVGPFSTASWENVIDNGDGSQRTMKSVSLRKGYYSKKEKMFKHQTITFDPAELGSVIGLLSHMANAVIEKRGGKMENNEAETEINEVGNDIPF